MLSELVLDRYPHATVVAFDLTEAMLQACRQRLRRFATRLEIKQGDFKADSLGASYDVILAGLSLHHLTNPERRDALARIHTALVSGGVFLAREVIVDEDHFVTEWHYALWCAFMRSNGEDDVSYLEKHRQKDHPVSIEHQIAWLRDVGFVHPACHARHWNFAVISAHKG